MKIGIDARMYAESGNGRYVRNLLTQLRLQDHTQSYVIYCLRKDYESIRLLFNSPSWQVHVADYRWYTVAEQLFFPFVLYRDNLDLVHFTHFNVPVLYFKKFVVTIHDLTHFSFAMKRASTRSPLVYMVKHWLYSFVFWYAVTWSSKIITVSEYVKTAIVDKFRTESQKISVIYEASERPVEITAAEKKKLLDTFRIVHPYFFYVGNAHPHKNLELLITSFVELRKTIPTVMLVLAGKENYFWTRLLTWAKENSYLENIIYLGYVSDTELAALYSSALGYVFPSLSEGFGLPVLEAMTYGCPVICSEVTSLPEIAGEAAVYIDPYNQDSLVRAMHMFYASSDIREEKIRLGVAQVKKYNWESMGTQTLAVYSSLS